MIKTLIVEDDALTRQELVALIGNANGFRVVASSGTLLGARDALDQDLDLVLLDLSLPDGSGLSLIPKIQDRLPNAKIVVLTVSADRVAAMQALRSGACGYLLKMQDNLVGRLQEAVDGQMPIDAGITPYLVSELQTNTTVVPLEDSTQTELTPREQQTLLGLAEGLSYAELAIRMKVSTHTVNGFIKEIYRKLGVNSRSKAVYEGVRQRLVAL